jgi:uncharacterized membrane protein YkoI
MKKSMFIALGFVLALTACTREPILSPDSSSNTTTNQGLIPSTGSSSSSSSVNITLTSAQKAAVNAVIASKYQGYSIKEAEKELEHGVTQYKVTIVSGNNKIRLLFNSAWQFIGEKN